MKKAVGYIRVSGESQIDGDGFVRQEKAIRDYAQTNGLDLIQIFREEGVSGTKEHRDALARMMLTLEDDANEIATVIIEKLDRLARDMMVQETIIRDFRKSGVALISTMEGDELCSDDPTRTLLRRFMGGIAEYDKEMTVRKLKVARDRIKANTGKCGGRNKLTDTDEGKKLIGLVKQYKRKPRQQSRPTYPQIAQRLNDEGHTTISGKAWTAKMVAHVANRYCK